MNLPVVSHSDYVTPLPDRHRFSMPKFKLLYELLLKDAIITSQ
ncbi:deacetylases [Geminocystis sp. NIES-3709]|nr:deacetylases [Geminocystis sp. NIES-3709]